MKKLTVISVRALVIFVSSIGALQAMQSSQLSSSAMTKAASEPGVPFSVQLISSKTRCQLNASAMRSAELLSSAMGVISSKPSVKLVTQSLSQECCKTDERKKE